MAFQVLVSHEKSREIDLVEKVWQVMNAAGGYR